MMNEKYIKEFKGFDRKKNEIDVDLVKSIIDTKNALTLAIKNYEYADGEMIDYYSYQIKANSSKLSYLLKNAKNNGLFIDMINQIKFNLLDREAM